MNFISVCPGAAFSRSILSIIALLLIPVLMGAHATSDRAAKKDNHSERIHVVDLIPDPKTATRRVSQTSIKIVQWPTQANQGDMIVGSFLGSNTGTASGGPFNVSDFKIKVTIPPELRLTSQTQDMGTWTVENNVATLDIGNFTAGAEFAFTMEFEATGFGTIELQFEIEQFEFHPGPNLFECGLVLNVTPVAYVDPAAAGPGGVGNPETPFPGVLEALDALRILSVDDKRICIVPASYPGKAVFDFEVRARTWNGQAGVGLQLDVPGEVKLPDGAVINPPPGDEIALGPDGLPDPANAEFRIETVLEVIKGTFVTNGRLDVGNLTRIEIQDGELVERGSGSFDFPTEWIPLDPPDGFGRDFNVGLDGIDLLYFGKTDRTVGLEWRPADNFLDPDPGNNVRNAFVDSGDLEEIIISLCGEEEFRVNGDLIIGANERGQSGASGSGAGTLDLCNGTLDINATNGNDTALDIHGLADLAGGDNGTVRFTGENRTDVWVESTVGRLRFDFPAIEVDRGSMNPLDDPRVTFNAEGILSDAPAGSPPNNLDEIRTTRFRLTLGGGAGSGGDPGGVDLLDGLDIFDIDGHYEQFGGEFRMAGVSSVGPDPDKSVRQRVRVGFRFDPGNMIIEDGEFYAGADAPDSPGGDVEVFGDFCLGCTPPTAENDPPPSDGRFSLAINGVHTVNGDFIVGPDTDPSDGPAVDPENRNRYFLGGECGVLPDRGGLFLDGNYNFQGTGDRFDDNDWLPEQQGLRGNVFFVGSVEQMVQHRQDEDAFFCDVVMASRGTGNDGIELQSDIWQNDSGTLTLERGIIDVGADSYDWIILNPGIEEDLSTRNNSERGRGVVDLGSRDSYINGEVDRRVQFGNQGGGVITGGYLFPVGSEGEPRDDNVPVNPRDADFFRPLILQFADDLDRSRLASVDYVGLGNPNIDPPPSPNPGKGSHGILPVLNTVSHLFWKLEFDEIPDQLLNIRLVADGLPGVNDITMLRMVQWDCNGTNSRMAGAFVGDDPASAMRVAVIDGVVSISHSGIEPQLCQLLGIASEHAINPIGPPPSTESDFSITKTAEPSTVPVFGTLTYTLTITNNGPEAGSAVSTDVLPADVSYDSHTGNCAIVNTTVTCTTGVVAPGQSEVFTILVLPQIVGAILNTASVAPVPPATDSNPNNDTSTAGATVAENTASETDSSVPTELSLLPNYPNPFNPSTTIRYALPHQSDVRLSVYDVLGREVAVLIEQSQPAGWHEVMFNAGDLPSGTYLYKLESDATVLSRVLVLLR